ncbi:LysR family transcriptional regulator [Klebsiella pneumoniae]|uniref:LysR family transcriptional regulator n=1 Tax=Klebsiella pneumoniae TaxID=573 RepID=UPI0010A3E3FC|nr:LysR family transcriptional regulator [Klebsiella pneumoniae]EIV2050102.1 LysR family transcriptional regulator [Klebsiella pneumoniae]EIV4017612.1 LysR family transcriptional regulator [Klebsiella pneumoniae]EKX8490553.1 LysR family transcriptional regulator [Klebsiella pneumoniae]MBK5850556.1 LysR family transcriptional regulator [Klebsiella pneumoniae]MBK5868891.1 LysR family transcriptional regulator [Klebsiella pneumoniae]
MRLDLADLRLFIAIVDTGSITGGAANAHLALASASERLRKMEAEIGVPLLHRHARGVTMTEAGEVLARHARPLLAQQQRLRLFANTSAMSAFLPGKLAAWMAAHPAVQIETEERTSADIVSCILAGVAQAGVVSDAVDPGPLRLDPVADDPLVLIVPPAHPLAEKEEVAFAAVLNEPLVALYQTSALQQHIEQHAAELGQALNVRIRMSHFAGLCEMVAHGAGGAILPRVIAERYRQRYSFAVIGLQDRWAQRRLCLCYQDDASLSPAMRRLLEWLCQP